MKKALMHFSHRRSIVKIALSPGIFIAAGASCMMLALITVTWKSWRMANINPAEALKNE